MRSSVLPLVSIVIPVYNGANYMREAIDSALGQTYPNIEVVVVNDGSTDGGATHEIALSYKDSIRYFQKENGGVSSALNYGIKHMNGEYFAWLSHDDKHLPQKVERQMDAVRRHEGDKPIICVCNYIVIDESGNEFARSPQDIEKYFRISPKCFFGSETGFMIDGDATLISRQLFDLCGGFDESLFASQETDMWFRSLGVADFIFMPDYLVEYRYHPQQVTNKRAESVGKEAGAYRGNLVKQVTIQEIENYYREEKDAIRFGVAAYSYMYLYFYEATHQMIVKLRQLHKNNWKFMRSVLTGMFEYGDADRILDVMNAVTGAETQKTKILVYCNDGIGESCVGRLKEFMANLQENYEFFLVHCGEKRFDLPANIKTIYFNQNAKPYQATYIALLAELLDVDILWGNAAYFLPNAIAMSYLSESRIRTIASFHYFEPDANMFSTNLNEEDWQAPLAKASIITHEQNDLMFTQHMYPYDAVLLPPLCGDMEVCEKWSMFFQTVLSPNYSAEQMRRDFLMLDRAEDDSPLPIEAIQSVQCHLEKYEEFVLGKHRKYYEHSPYWRITKPLRMVADLFRK